MIYHPIQKGWLKTVLSTCFNHPKLMFFLDFATTGQESDPKDVCSEAKAGKKFSPPAQK
jgi:hypothetical protein